MNHTRPHIVVWIFKYTALRLYLQLLVTNGEWQSLNVCYVLLVFMRESIKLAVSFFRFWTCSKQNVLLKQSESVSSLSQELDSCTSALLWQKNIQEAWMRSTNTATNIKSWKMVRVGLFSVQKCTPVGYIVNLGVAAKVSTKWAEYDVGGGGQWNNVHSLELELCMVPKNWGHSHKTVTVSHKTLKFWVMMGIKPNFKIIPISITQLYIFLQIKKNIDTNRKKIAEYVLSCPVVDKVLNYST